MKSGRAAFAALFFALIRLTVALVHNTGASIATLLFKKRRVIDHWSTLSIVIESD
jgi:hypothetical protein